MAQADPITEAQQQLVAGTPWPAIERPGDAFVGADDRPWVEMTGFPGSAVKVLYADRASNTVAFLYRLGPNHRNPASSNRGPTHRYCKFHLRHISDR